MRCDARQSSASDDRSRQVRKLRNLRRCEPLSSNYEEDTADWKDLVRAVVNCKVREFAIALLLIVFTVFMISINPTTNPNPYVITICVTTGFIWTHYNKYKEFRRHPELNNNTVEHFPPNWIIVFLEEYE
jgi:hypothetical protein